ncbi:GNAT family N-acetyltransferase [Nocardioides sp. 1609]|uniref:GNAT family N-acetyltransferase n=1 Tax=Nocardioides sp. 1609 TaxID=2508327 RepID=UPI00106F85A7|nr:GNAT family N-acetyltransferase [Nocardioides sp. 1609]
MTATPPAALDVVRNDDESRYEIRDGDTLLGFAAYQETPELVVFTHTEVFPGSEGKGVGGHLVGGALDDVRTRELRALPVCPFVQAYLQRHPEYADLDYRAPRSTASD